jgi:hypothetical protein
LDNAARITSIRELDRLLGLLAAVRGRAGSPHAVDLLPAGAVDGGLQIGVGHPDRSFVRALDGAGGYAVDPHLEPWPEPIAFDCGREVVDFKPAWTRVSPAAAVEAAREYVRSAGRDIGLEFDPNA